jgi:PAS domain S-box-containing protein
MKKELRVLILEDNPNDVVLIRHELRKSDLPFRAKRVETKKEFLEEIQNHQPDVILSDHGVPAFDGFTALSLAKNKCPQVPFIFVTGSVGEVVAIETLKSGATDYVLKSRLSSLVPSIQRALRESEDRDEYRRATIALHESEQRFNILTQNLKDIGIFSIDFKGIISEWNTSAENVFKYKGSEIVGEHISTFYPDRLLGRDQATHAIEVALNSGIFQEEGLRVTKDGFAITADITFLPIKGGLGEVRGLFCVIRDLSASKKNTTESSQLDGEPPFQGSDSSELLKKRNAELETLNQELEAFSYSVAHDLKTPLRHIINFIDLLNKNSAQALDQKSVYYLNTVDQSARKMDKYIEDMLSFCRMDSTEMYELSVNMDELLKVVLLDLKQDTEGRHIDWDIGELPEVHGDPVLLCLVLVNLISNALKFTRTRNMARIEVKCIQSSAVEHVFMVRDNGVGFNMKHAQKLFGAFQRLHNAVAFEGSGVGLANVRRIIQRHGGKTWVEAEEDKGAAFYFSIPNKAHA